MAERLGMATVEQQREAIKKIFKDSRRVDRMSSEQVTAIYLRLKNEGKL